jgi:hypothetical protein
LPVNSVSFMISVVVGAWSVEVPVWSIPLENSVPVRVSDICNILITYVFFFCSTPHDISYKILFDELSINENL